MGYLRNQCILTHSALGHYPFRYDWPLSALRAVGCKIYAFAVLEYKCFNGIWPIESGIS